MLFFVSMAIISTQSTLNYEYYSLFAGDTFGFVWLNVVVVVVLGTVTSHCMRTNLIRRNIFLISRTISILFCSLLIFVHDDFTLNFICLHFCYFFFAWKLSMEIEWILFVRRCHVSLHFCFVCVKSVSCDFLFFLLFLRATFWIVFSLSYVFQLNRPSGFWVLVSHYKLADTQFYRSNKISVF